MMPIVFCASFAPWPMLNAAADTNCSARNVVFTRFAVLEPVHDPHDDDDEARSPSTRPMSGE